MLMKRPRFALLVGGVVLGAVAANATSLKQLSFSDLVYDANVVVLAEAVASRAVVGADGVTTVTTFNVEDSILGSESGQIEVVTPGGAYKPGKFRVSESTADTPAFPIGSELMLFLDPAAGGAWQVVGFSQGALKVIEASGEKMVRLPEADREETVTQAKSRIRAEKSRGAKRDRVDND